MLISFTKSISLCVKIGRMHEHESHKRCLMKIALQALLLLSICSFCNDQSAAKMPISTESVSDSQYKAMEDIVDTISDLPSNIDLARINATKIGFSNLKAGSIECVSVIDAICDNYENKRLYPLTGLLSYKVNKKAYIAKILFPGAVNAKEGNCFSIFEVSKYLIKNNWHGPFISEDGIVNMYSRDDSALAVITSNSCVYSISRVVQY